MSEDKKRVCGTCAWWERYDPMIAGIEPDRPAGDCCYDPAEVQKGGGEWCRHHSFTTGWEKEKRKRPDTEYVQFLERMRKGPPPEEDEDGPLRGAIDYDMGRRVSHDKIKALQEQLRDAYWLITRAAPCALAKGKERDWYTSRDAWLEKQDDE